MTSHLIDSWIVLFTHAEEVFATLECMSRLISTAYPEHIFRLVAVINPFPCTSDIGVPRDDVSTYFHQYIVRISQEPFSLRYVRFRGILYLPELLHVDTETLEEVDVLSSTAYPGRLSSVVMVRNGQRLTGSALLSKLLRQGSKMYWMQCLYGALVPGAEVHTIASSNRVVEAFEVCSSMAVLNKPHADRIDELMVTLMSRSQMGSIQTYNGNWTACRIMGDPTWFTERGTFSDKHPLSKVLMKQIDKFQPAIVDPKEVNILVCTTNVEKVKEYNLFAGLLLFRGCSVHMECLRVDHVIVAEETQEDARLIATRKVMSVRFRDGHFLNYLGYSVTVFFADDTIMVDFMLPGKMPGVMYKAHAKMEKQMFQKQHPELRGRVTDNVFNDRLMDIHERTVATRLEQHRKQDVFDQLRQHTSSFKLWVDTLPHMDEATQFNAVIPVTVVAGLFWNAVGMVTFNLEFSIPAVWRKKIQDEPCRKSFGWDHGVVPKVRFVEGRIVLFLENRRSIQEIAESGDHALLMSVKPRGLALFEMICYLSKLIDSLEVTTEIVTLSEQEQNKESLHEASRMLADITGQVRSE